MAPYDQHQHQHQQQQQEAPLAYPPRVTEYPPAAAYVYPPPTQFYPPQQQLPAEGHAHGPYAAPPPPPMGYPTSQYPQQNRPVQNTSRGDDFWKGCFAALCCCCVLDFCFY